MYLRHEPKVTAEFLAIEAAGQRYRQTETFIFPGGTIHSTGDTMVIMRRGGLAQLCFNKYRRQVNDCLFKANILEVLLYGCFTWTLLDSHYLREYHLGLLLRYLDMYKKGALQLTACPTELHWRGPGARASR